MFVIILLVSYSEVIRVLVTFATVFSFGTYNPLFHRIRNQGNGMDMNLPMTG